MSENNDYLVLDKNLRNSKFLYIQELHYSEIKEDILNICLKHNNNIKNLIENFEKYRYDIFLRFLNKNEKEINIIFKKKLLIEVLKYLKEIKDDVISTIKSIIEYAEKQGFAAIDYYNELEEIIYKGVEEKALITPSVYKDSFSFIYITFVKKGLKKDNSKILSLYKLKDKEKVYKDSKKILKEIKKDLSKYTSDKTIYNIKPTNLDDKSYSVLMQKIIKNIFRRY